MRTLFRATNVKCLTWLVLLLVVAGCTPRSKVQPPTRYTGPVEPLDVVVAAYNANVRAISTLWAAADFEANLVDDQGKAMFVNGDATLLFARPGQFRFFMNKLGNRLFDAGINAEKFWLVGYEGVDQAWAGSLNALNRPDAPRLPVRPDLLAEVLGISMMPTDFTTPPIVTQRFNPDLDMYMLTFLSLDDFRGDRFRVTKEVWLDRKMLLPRFVFLHDPDGQVVLRAQLADHRTVKFGDAAARLAFRFSLLFPQSDSTLVLKLQEVRPRNRGIPTSASFAFSLDRVNVSKVTDLDLP